jgi:hypothetical protein
VRPVFIPSRNHCATMNAAVSSRSFVDSGRNGLRFRPNCAKQSNEQRHRALLCQARPDRTKNPQGIITRDELLGVEV